MLQLIPFQTPLQNHFKGFGKVCFQRTMANQMVNESDVRFGYISET
jgi:hypothetical protein